MSESSTGMWCEWIGCTHEAWYRTSAQWSLFDWMHWYVCLDHLPEAEAWLSHRQVDNEYPFEVATVTLELQERGSL